MFSKQITYLVIFIFTIFQSQAQNCNLSIKGTVIDEISGLPLSFVTVYLEELAIGTNTDDKGAFEINGICADTYHLAFSQIGCTTSIIHLELSKDTLINIDLECAGFSLDNVEIKGKKEDLNNQPNLSVDRLKIEDNSNRNFSGLLENEAGVHLIKNGSGIAKPIVQGMYGNRLTILNNEIIQSGQQWGNDHSPEIDPLAADKITILKGASAIEYNGNLGSIILVEPKKIDRLAELQGQVNYSFETNGNGNNLNIRLEKYSAVLGWRISGTLKKYGDKNTPDYFLNNTGIEEANFSVQLEKVINPKLSFNFYASTFNTRLGILRGAHIGNLTDLENALSREIPFFTEENFSYQIEAPKQEVSHHLAKLKAKYFINQKQKIEFFLANQLNKRTEFDVRRSGRTDIPALSLLQLTLNTEIKYSHTFNDNWEFRTGYQNIITDNTNNPETGILPLIPNYRSFKNGVFTTLYKKLNKLSFDWGIRYDFERQSVVRISNSLPREIIRETNKFHNVSSLFALKYHINQSQSINYNIGFATRNPAINELYSNGLHQGVSGIEEGDVNLEIEKSLKNTVEYQWSSGDDFKFSALLYHQYFNNYIFLNPQDEISLTIRGAFPVFKYEQANANIYGLDISAQFRIKKQLSTQIRYSFLRGNDIENDIPLIFMPPNRIFANLVYKLKKEISINKKLSLSNTELEVNNRFVFSQNNILPEQDFVLPPSSYNLIGFKISSNLMFDKYQLRIFLKAENLLNNRYRDYLNRQRYFADDLGRSIIIGTNFKF